MEQGSLDLGLALDTDVEPATADLAISVYPLVPTRGFDRALTYSVPVDWSAPLVAGQLVEVPIGKAARVGVVCEVDVERPDGIRLKSIVRPVASPPVPQHLIALAEWIADTYATARTRALAMVVPPRLATHARAAAVPHRASVIAYRRTSMPNDAVEISRRLQQVCADTPTEWTSAVELCRELGTTRASLDRLAEAGLLERSSIVVDRWRVQATASSRPTESPSDRKLQLTDEQQAAVDAIFAEDAPATLLAGVTGSGKTEVYLAAIERVLSEGESAIVLVPEISLTPQTARRFIARFGTQVEVLHSALTKAERQRAWERIAAGESTVVVGPRSACFAPLARPGIIIIDEEHDSSYKQESDPRYDVRRVAYRLGQLTGARVVYGSATPRPESWAGITHRVRLRARAGGAALPPVQLIDMREQPEHYPLGLEARAALDATIRRGRKAIVLHNRRGYATALHCTGCGHGFRCAACDVFMVVHGRVVRGQSMVCHHCGARAPIPPACPDCGSADLARRGVGTERLERDLRDLLGDARIVRLDADAVAEQGDVSAILDAFGEPGPAVLVGTQMIAKGHDFADVELVVVVDADTALAIPDFRAEERAFTLVAQVAGRAGRSLASSEHAKVIVQSFSPDAPHLQLAMHHDVEGFLDDELARRQVTQYPPYCRLVRVVISVPSAAEQSPTRAHRSGADLERWTAAIHAGLRQLNAGTVLGPVPLLRIGSRDRMQLLLKTTADAAAAAAALRSFLAKTHAERSRADVRIVVDVDPQSIV